MVCSEVVHLPPEHLCPEVFANELHDIQLILEAGGVPGQSGQSITSSQPIKRHDSE